MDDTGTARVEVETVDGRTVTVLDDGRIEMPEELEMMRKLGVELGQGYYLERPSKAY